MALKTQVALAAPVHQPDERLAPMIDTYLPDLTARYASVSTFCSPETHPTIIGLLRQNAVRVSVGQDRSQGIYHIGEVRRQTIRLGLESGAPYLQTCDFDRALHWAAYHLRELDEIISEIPAYDLLVLGRTARAWATHPPYQAQTEPLFNKVFALATGLEWDIGAGSRGLSRRAAATLLDISEERTVGVDAEWPLLLLNRPDFCVGHRCCEGLEFETADRYAPEIAAAGSYEKWERNVSADPAQWVFRLQIASMIAETVTRHQASNRG